MKSYTMHSDDAILLKKGNGKQFVILFFAALALILVSTLIIGYQESSSLILIILPLNTIYVHLNTGVDHLELDNQTLSCFRKGKLKNTFDLKQVKLELEGNENSPRLLIKEDSDLKARYSSQNLGLITLNELVTDLSAITEVTNLTTPDKDKNKDKKQK